MVSNKKKPAPIDHPIKFILIFSVAITLFFGTQLQDPFNTPKLAILIVLATGLIPYLFESTNNQFKLNHLERVLIFSLIIGLLVSTLLSSDKYVAIFGESQRKLGFLTYVCFIIVLLIGLKYFNRTNIKLIYTALFTLACVLTVYGFLQTTGNDPVKWNNQYNSIITVFGNPNFASAFFAMLSIAMFARFLLEKVIILKLINFILIFLMLILIWRSQSRQGLVAFSIGVAVILIVVLGKRKKLFGVVALTVFGSLFILAVLGMLQIGPLTSLLYKDSISVRGFYWRAAFEMFLYQPFNGVGIDKYGSFFKEYREIQYPLTYGFNLTSTNAHNVYLQLLATGGLIVALPYIALKIYVGVNGIKYILKNSGTELILFTGLFACWVAYEAQSVISIDNIGVTIWGWLLAGAILAVSKDKKVLTSEKQSHLIANFRQLNLNLISYFLIIPAVIFGLFLTKGEGEMWKARVIGESTGFQPSEQLKSQILKAVQSPLLDPMWKIMCADYLSQMGDIASGSKLIDEILEKDSRNLDALQVGSRIYAAENKTDLAIELQFRISEIDPYNVENFYVLLKNYKVLGDLDKAQIALEKIKQIAPNSEQFKLATKELAMQAK